MTSRTALVAGATGIVGLNLATHLASQSDWRVYGLARNPSAGEGVQPVAADLLDPVTLRGALRGIEPTHVFLTSWLRQPTEAENIRSTALWCAICCDALSSIGSVQHVALVTGLKHYLGPVRELRQGQPAGHAIPRRAGADWTSTISTTRRKTRSSLRPSATASTGACIVRTPLSATR